MSTKVKHQEFEHKWLVDGGRFELVFWVSWNSPDSSRTQIFREVLGRFSYFSMKMYAVCTKCTHKNRLIEAYHYLKVRKDISKFSPLVFWPSAMFISWLEKQFRCPQIMFEPLKFDCICGMVGRCESGVYLISPGRPTDTGLQLGKACYPCSR